MKRKIVLKDGEGGVNQGYIRGGLIDESAKEGEGLG